MIRCARTVTTELFFHFSRAAVVCSEIVEAFAAEVSGGLRKSLLERLEGFESFSTSVKDRCVFFACAA